MRLFGFDLTASRAPSDAISLFGRDPIEKAELPAGATISESGTAALSRMAAASVPGAALGSSLAAQGIRPNPGVLPDQASEAEADPLRFQFPWGGNISYTPRSGYGTPFSILRSLASTSPVVGLCVQCRKDQMASLDFDFSARDKKQKDGAITDKIAQARAFFAKPDRVTPFKTWVQTLVDEVLTIDALSIYKRPTKLGAAKRAKNPNYQLAPDEIYGYEIIDGATVKVLLDGRGATPLPPQIAYRQIIYGAPVSGGDLRQDELAYLPKNVRTWTPYGMSPLETILLIVTADLNRSLFNLSYYAEGNIPEALVGVPNNWSPKQIRQFQEYWDLVLRGDPKNRSKLKFVVETMAKSIHEFKKPDFTTAYDLWLLKLQCACYGVTPSEIGFTDDVNKATSKSQGDVNQRRGVKPMANYIKGIIDTMLVELGLSELESTYSGGEGEDALSKAKIEDMQVRNGTKSIDEIRAANGDPTIGVGPVIVTTAGAVTWASIAAAQTTPVDDDPALDDTTDAEDGTPGADATAIAQQSDLKKYQTVATKAVRVGKAVPAFTSAVIPARVLARLSQALTTVDSPDAVRKVFDRVRKGQRLNTVQKQHSQRMAAKLTSVLAGERAAVVAHITSGVEAHP